MEEANNTLQSVGLVAATAAPAATTTATTPFPIVLCADSIDGLELQVEFALPAYRSDLVTAVGFLNGQKGYYCSGFTPYQSVSGSPSHAGEYTHTIQLGQSKAAGQWRATTALALFAYWWDGKGDGPISITLRTSNVFSNGTVVAANSDQTTAFSVAARDIVFAHCPVGVHLVAVARVYVKRNGSVQIVVTPT